MTDKAPEKEQPKKTRGILKSEPRPQKAPTSKGFLEHKQKGMC